ncbi:TPA: hypothetical protein ACH3X1_015008 [Trebouxia sp. C0004]
MRTSQSASSPRHVHTSERASVGDVSAATTAGTAQQRTNINRPTLLSPFATCEVQDSQAQPEEIKPVSSRKRARCQSADLDITPLTKFAQVSSRQQQQHALTAGALPIQHIVTLHKPTPQRPNASTSCCFGVASATQPLQHSHLRSTSLNTAQPPAAQPAASPAVPNSLPTATLANAATVGKSTVSEPSDEDRASPFRREHSQECKHCQASTASDSSEVVSDNSHQMSAQPPASHIQPSASFHNLTRVCTQPSIHLQTQSYNASPTYINAQHLTPSPTVIHSSINPFTTYGYSSGYTSGYTSGSLSPATTYVVVSGNSPKHSAGPSDKYVAAVVQDAQGNSQHVTVAASAISTGGPSYVLPTTLAVPFTPLNPMANSMAHSLAATQQTIAFGGTAQHVLTPGVTYAHSMAGLGPMGLGSAGGLSAMGLGLSSNFGMTQAGYNILPRVPLTMAPSMVPSMQVNPQDKAQCIGSSTNVRIY